MIMVQEEINHRSVVVTVTATKMTARVLAKALAKVTRAMNGAKMRSNSPGKEKSHGELKPGKVSVKELSANGKDGLQKIPVTDDNIKAFEPIARKYGITYALARDESETPPKWAVFFRAKDSDVLSVAFAEFTKKILTREEEHSSVLEAIREFAGKAHDRTRDRQKVRERSGPER
jgi:hypothetical protein